MMANGHVSTAALYRVQEVACVTLMANSHTFELPTAHGDACDDKAEQEADCGTLHGGQIGLLGFGRSDCSSLESSR